MYGDCRGNEEDRGGEMKIALVVIIVLVVGLLLCKKFCKSCCKTDKKE